MAEALNSALRIGIWISDCGLWKWWPHLQIQLSRVYACKIENLIFCLPIHPLFVCSRNCCPQSSGLSVRLTNLLKFCLPHRPVDCYTHEPLVFVPGFVNSTIYSDQVETGWTFGPYFEHSADFWRQGETLLCDSVLSLSKANAQPGIHGGLTALSRQTGERLTANAWQQLSKIGVC